MSDEELERLKSEGQSFSSSTTKISGLPQQLASDNPQLQTGNIKALKVSIDTHQQEMPEFNVSQYLESPLPLNSPLTPKFLPPDGDMCISMSPPVGSGSVEQGMSISPVGMSASVRRVKTQDTEEIDSVRHKDGDGLHVLGMVSVMELNQSVSFIHKVYCFLSRFTWILQHTRKWAGFPKISLQILILPCIISPNRDTAATSMHYIHWHTFTSSCHMTGSWS